MCSVSFAAALRISRLRPFKAAQICVTQTDLSLRSGWTDESRDFAAAGLSIDECLLRYAETSLVELAMLSAAFCNEMRSRGAIGNAEKALMRLSNTPWA